MGILKEPAAFIRELNLPKGFSVCELGDQYLTFELPHRLAKDWYQELGCKRYVSIDANGRGTVTFDLNRKWQGKTGEFDLVTDFGTGEHIFNQAELWRTIHLLTKPRGFIAFDHPCTGYEGHGFYCVDACLYQALAGANRYEIITLQRTQASRGELVRGVFQKMQETKFQAPQQGRYQKSMQI
jgi:hypothetical protein